MNRYIIRNFHQILLGRWNWGRWGG